MRLDNQRESSNVEDDRGSGGGMGSPFSGGSSFGGGGGGTGLLLTLLLNTIGFRGVIILGVVYFGLKIFTGIDLLTMVNGSGGGIQMPTINTQIAPRQAGTVLQNSDTTNGQAAASDSGKQFVARVLGSTEDVWTRIFSGLGKQYDKPRLVLFSNFIQSGCGTAQSSMGPFYCPADRKVYIDLAFYQELKDKLGAPGDFAQAYVVAHEVGHHVQNLLGITNQVEASRRQASDVDANRLSVKVELQADCFAGVWATQADAMNHILESGDVEQALNAASQIGDDHLQKMARGRAIPDTFTHGASAQRVKWFKTGLQAESLNDCDTFSATNL